VNFSDKAFLVVGPYVSLALIPGFVPRFVVGFLEFDSFFLCFGEVVGVVCPGGVSVVDTFFLEDRTDLRER